MANAKRASMREGPLAALFRKTEGAEEEQVEPAEGEQPAHRRAPRRPRRRRTRARAACRTRR